MRVKRPTWDRFGERGAVYSKRGWLHEKMEQGPRSKSDRVSFEYSWHHIQILSMQAYSVALGNSIRS